MKKLVKKIFAFLFKKEEVKEKTHLSKFGKNLDLHDDDSCVKCNLNVKAVSEKDRRWTQACIDDDMSFAAMENLSASMRRLVKEFEDW